MKTTLGILGVFFVGCLWAAGNGDVQVFAPSKPREGVFFTYTGYMTTVLELKDGHFRYWFESDVKLPKEPAYPLTGQYTLMGETIVLNHDHIFQKQWTYRAINGVTALWRPDAVSGITTLTDAELKRILRYGAGSILVAVEKPAEEVWRERRAPSQ